MSNDTLNCGFMEYYDYNISGYVNITICSTGAILNLFNILVFTKKHMISSANLIFTHLALVDLLILLSCIPYSWINFFQYTHEDYENLTHTRALIYLFLVNIGHTLSYTSVFLTLMLAMWRYIAIVHPLKERYWCNMKTTRNMIIASYIISILLSTPTYYSDDIVISYTDDELPYYETDYKEDSWTLINISFLMKAVLQQLLPSIVLPIFSFRMIAALKTKTPEQLTSSSNARNNTRNLKRKQQTDRSIAITLIVMALFLAVQIRPGIYNLISIITGLNEMLDYDRFECFHTYVLVLLNVTLNYISMSVTFVVYYTMSQNFRATFQSLFCKRRIFSQTTVFSSVTRRTDTCLELDQVQ
ncbi:FMRFamide receptor-like [Planococcus citri]|uniref:FMRFamide receptor-like n=1 Tax=Planococcus citri TaxID=170843 RepID=UPI0031FA366C